MDCVCSHCAAVPHQMLTTWPTEIWKRPCSLRVADSDLVRLPVPSWSRDSFHQCSKTSYKSRCFLILWDIENLWLRSSRVLREKVTDACTSGFRGSLFFELPTCTSDYVVQLSQRINIGLSKALSHLRHSRQWCDVFRRYISCIKRKILEPVKGTRETSVLCR